MKTNKFADLVRFGLKPKTLFNLSESSINTLHKTLIEGKKEICPKCKSAICKCKKKEETKEEVKQNIQKVTYDPTVQTDRDKLAAKGIMVDPTSKKVSLNQGKEEKKNEKILKGGETTESKKKKKTQYPGVNPWAVCHSQLGPRKTPKFERCVKAVKQSIGEGKNPFSVLLEEKILSLLETHLQPKMKKGEIMNLVGKKTMKLPIGKLSSIGGSVSENTKEKEAPVKNPGTKTPPKPKTKDPFRPEPHKQPNPKAKHKKHEKHETKEAVMDAPAPTKKPKVDPGTKTPTKPKTKDPFRPEPHKQPNPKAKKRTSLPSWLTFNNLGIKLKK